MENKQRTSEGIFDARSLGVPKMIILGLQHTFAMFGATVLVPILTGLSVSTTLLMAGLGTLLFHILAKGKVPAFLGSSFAFIGGYTTVTAAGEKAGMSVTESLPYACLGVAVAGLVYLVLAALIKGFGIKRVMKFFPPVVTGPIIIAIGLILAPVAIENASTNWLLAIVALAIIIIFNIWGRGMAKIIPIILGVLGAYLVAVIFYIIGACNPELVKSVPWLFKTLDFTGVKAVCDSIAAGNFFGPQGVIGLPVTKEGMVFGNINNWSFALSAIVAVVPISLATMMEHIGDISAISATCGKNYIKDPGLHRTLLGDGLATSMASLFGGPANTTYGENTGVLALTKVYDPKVVRIAAYFAIFFSFFPIISAVIGTIPSSIVGGISFMLYGMISAIGVRNVVENKVDFTKSRNLIIAAVILVSALGFNAMGGVSFTLFGAHFNLSGLALAAILGIVLNAVLPGKDFDFNDEESDAEDVGATFKV